MSKRILLSLAVLFLSLLQACGGGDSSGGGANSKALAPAASAAEEPATADIGTVSARFVSNENTRSMLLSAGGQSAGSDGATEQTDSGAMVRLGSKTLSGTRQTVDIAGDAHFALGRWVRGTATQTSGTRTLKGQDSDSHHYLTYHALTELPASGRLQCTTVAATAPTLLFGSYAQVGSASGSASISFDANGAVIQGAMEVRVGEESARVNLFTHTEQAGYMHLTGQLLANGPGAAIALADQDSGIPGLVVGYKAQLPSGALYNGVARLACTSV